MLLPSPAAFAADVGVEAVRDGLGPGTVEDVLVDADGWLWVGTIGGLFRYERPARRWGGDYNDAVASIVAVRGEVALIQSTYGQLLTVTRDDASAVRDDRGRPLAVTDAAVDPRGRLWVVRDGALLLGRGARLEPVDVGLDGPATGVQWGPTGGWVLSATAVVQLDADGAPQATYAATDAVALAEAGGAWFVQSALGEVRRLGAAEALVPASSDRAMGFVARGDALWSSQSLRLTRVGTDGRTRVFDDAGALGSGGALAVDLDGGLWKGGYLGLFHVAAPETRVYTRDDGLPDSHPRTLAVDPDGTRWVTSWRSPARLGADGRATPIDGVSFTEGELCPDGRGGWWTAGDRPARDGTFRVLRLGDPPTLGPALTGQYWDCAPSPDGGIWFLTSASLRHQSADGVLSRPLGDGGYRVHEARDGTLWRTTAREVCRAEAAAVRRGQATWACVPWPGEAFVSDFAEVGEALWVTTVGAGAWRWDGHGFAPLAGAQAEPTRQLLWMTDSPRGGVWVAGHGVALRAAPDGDDWRLLERIGAEQGLPVAVAHQIVEEPSGRLHVATPAGLVEIPADGRTAPRPLPPPAPVAARLDGAAFDPDAPVTIVGPGHLLELDYALPSYRDPVALQWRVRASPTASWSPVSQSARFQWVDLAYGAYEIEVAVRAGTGPWVSAPSRPRVTVARPWTQRPPALAAYAALALGAAYAAYRLRLEALLRVERERTRIAMDLHDEVGSGLGSITLLAGLAADEGVPDEERRSVATEAARIAQDLTGALGDIVSALGKDAGSPAALFAWLAERGGRLFDPEQARFDVEAPVEYPDTSFSVAVRREVKQIVLEALHNAARHAAPSRVVLRVVPGPTWQVEVEDDGRGLDAPTTRAGTGLGRRGMAARAARIGAQIAWTSPPGGGTRVTLRFDPRGRRWPWRRLS